MRGDFSIRKLDSYSQRKMAGVTFEVTSLDSEGKEIEKHRFTTDSNGFFDSSAAWTYARKNQKTKEVTGQESSGDQADDTESQGQVNPEGTAGNSGEQEQNDPAGDTSGHNSETDKSGDSPDTEQESGRIWFGIGTSPDDSLGALPYGDYIIEEIEGENNRGRKMFSDRFSVYADRQMILL